VYKKEKEEDEEEKKKKKKKKKKRRNELTNGRFALESCDVTIQPAAVDRNPPIGWARQGPPCVRRAPLDSETRGTRLGIPIRRVCLCLACSVFLSLLASSFVRSAVSVDAVVGRRGSLLHRDAGHLVDLCTLVSEADDDGVGNIRRVAEISSLHLCFL